MNRIDRQEQIETRVEEIKRMLLHKNKMYGDSVLTPMNCLSGSNAIDGILIRVDDKLNRLKNIRENDMLVDDGEDTVEDIIGYLILLTIALKEEVNCKAGDR